MGKAPITKETEAVLLKNTEQTIEFVSEAIDVVRSLIRKIKNIEDSFEEHGMEFENKTFIAMKSMLEYRMLIGIIYLDLASVIRAHLHSKSNYEKLFSSRQIIVIVNEGYKQIYNFVRRNEKGDLITRNRNKSFWYKDIRNVIENSLPELIEEYKSLSQKLEDYFDNNFSSIKEQRDLSVHYDKEASKVYDMTVRLDIEDTFLKVSPFLEILIDMFRFTKKMALTSGIKEKKKSKERINQFESFFDEIIDKVKSERTRNNKANLNKLIDVINTSKVEFLNKIEK